MESSQFGNIKVNPAVKSALRKRSAVVALETAVVTHGLPRPINFQLACEMEDIIQQAGALPATIGMIDGIVYGGLTREQLSYLAEVKTARKLSQRDFGSAIATHSDGGTTVAGTTIIAHAIGIPVFATGGIGGVHRDSRFDISADLPVLAKTPLIVVCAGAKAILDLPATLEYLETMGIPVIGFQTDEFPAFYSISSGLAVSQRVDTVGMVVDIARSHFGMGINSAILVVVPPPAEIAIPVSVIEGYIDKAIKDGHRAGIHGAATTPYLLTRMGELTDGRSLKTNLALLKNNARVAAEIATALTRPIQRTVNG
ncbi:MAG: pseudouridine-5'-phosphate glycosidase [Anaerolineaceae bacterium]